MHYWGQHYVGCQGAIWDAVWKWGSGLCLSLVDLVGVVVVVGVGVVLGVAGIC